MWAKYKQGDVVRPEFGDEDYVQVIVGIKRTRFDGYAYFLAGSGGWVLEKYLFLVCRAEDRQDRKEAE